MNVNSTEYNTKNTTNGKTTKAINVVNLISVIFNFSISFWSLEKTGKNNWFRIEDKNWNGIFASAKAIVYNPSSSFEHNLPITNILNIR